MKGREGSTWIFVQGPRVPSYATGYSENKERGRIRPLIYVVTFEW